MKAMIVLLVVSALCATAVAAGQVAPAPRPSANRQYSSNILNSPDVVTIPRQLSYQGRLTDTLGVPVSDSSYPVTFRLYDMPSGGTPFWSESLDVQTSGGLFTVLLGSTRPVDSMPAYGLAYLAMQVGSGSELVPRMQLVSSAYSFVAGNAARLDGNDMSVLDVRYLQNGSPAGGDLGGDYPNPTVDGLQGRSVAGTAPGANQVLKWTGSAWAPGNDSAGGGGDNAWVRGTPDSVLYTVNQLGIVRGGAGNMLYGNLRCTHTNFGVACTTGVSGQNTAGVTISGGTSNLASSDYCTIAGGRFNGATMHDATVAGGNKDTASAVSSTVGGGYHNVASADYATIAGGDMNRAPGSEATIGGGQASRATGDFSTVCGGKYHVAGGECSFVGGGQNDTALGVYAGVASGYSNLAGDAAADTAAVVAGGYDNVATARYASVAGGSDNAAGYGWGCIGGGQNNVNAGGWSVIGGGSQNQTSASYAVVAGGSVNGATGQNGTVGGGNRDTASAAYATVGGGYHNVASAMYATIAGGDMNRAPGTEALVGGGQASRASGDFSTVGGGKYHVAGGECSFVGGGQNDTALGVYAGVASGYSNMAGDAATDTGAFVGGGYDNEATGLLAAIGGGRDNSADGSCATIPGGSGCSADGNYSFACGRNAHSASQGCFTWGDANSGSVTNSTANRWVARAAGGVYFYTNSGMTTGSYLDAGGSSWNSVSDSMTKENFRPVDKQALLAALARMRVRDYNLKSQDASIRHIGPVAQDFHSAFGFGESNTAINMEDADGIALAAIQALYEDNRQLRQEVEALKVKLTGLK